MSQALLDALRPAARRLWPVPRLRWLLLAVLVFAAALPGVAALGLRVYENALVRRTEAEIGAQAAALAATAALLWPGSQPGPAAGPVPLPQEPVSGIDLRSSTILPERPAAQPAARPADPAALATVQRIAPAIAETRRATLAAIVLLDRHGTVLLGRDAGRSLAKVEEVRAALAGRPQTALRANSSYRHGYLLAWLSRATDLRLHHARPVLVNGAVAGVVLVSRSPSALFRGMWEDRGKIALGVAVIFALLVAVAAILARSIVTPLERLAAATRALAAGREAPLRRPTLEVQEVSGLYSDFAAMAEGIARRSRYLRDFAASLSHEFKTPLAGIRGGIELLQDHGAAMDETERARFLANIESDAQRLSRLVSRLMELAKADMGKPARSARTALAPVLARLADAHAAPGFAIIRSLPPRLPRLGIDPGALETVLATLIENARQAGAAQLAISATADPAMVRIVLTDDGPGVPAADRLRVFEPFFTSRRESGGTGLGLPIARALVEASGGWIDLIDSPAGACFAMTLPVSD